jgi:hypothetical protein
MDIELLFRRLARLRLVVLIIVGGSVHPLGI